MFLEIAIGAYLLTRRSRRCVHIHYREVDKDISPLRELSSELRSLRYRAPVFKKHIWDDRTQCCTVCSMCKLEMKLLGVDECHDR